MSSEFEDHLLSAYLDDELSADERALVEQRLQTDESAREQLEDLRRVRGLVATLPGWPGALMAFDGSRLVIEPQQLADTSETGETLAQASSPAQPLAYVSSSAPTSNLNSEAASDLKSASAHVLPGRDRTSQGSSRWQMLLAVAAGLLVLLLAGPWLLNSLQSPLAFETSSGVGGGAAPNAGADAIAEAMQSEISTDSRSMESLDAASPMGAPASPGGAVATELKDSSLERRMSADSPAAKSTSPPPPSPMSAPAGAARANDYSDNNLKKNAETAASASAGLGATASASPSPNMARGMEGITGGMAGGMGGSPADLGRLARPPQTRADPSANLAENVASNSNSLVLGYSNAWSVEEVQQSLPTILPYMPVAPTNNSALSSVAQTTMPERTRDATAQPNAIQPKTLQPNAKQDVQLEANVERNSNQPAIANAAPANAPLRSEARNNQVNQSAALSIAQLPETESPEFWFESVRSVGELTQLPTAVTASSINDALANNSIANNMAINSDAARNAGASNADARSNQRSAAAADTALSKPSTDKQLPPSESRNGSLVLFVTEGEANQILQRIESLERTQQSRSQNQRTQNQRAQYPQAQSQQAAPPALPQQLQPNEPLAPPANSEGLQRTRDEEQMKLRGMDPSQRSARQDSSRVWRINPQQRGRQTNDQPAEPQPTDKVILILNQAP